MTIKAFGELCIELLGRNSQDFTIDQRIAIAAAQTIFGKLLQDKIDNGENIANYFSWDIFPVKEDTRIGQKYIQPYPRVMSIGDNDGIGQIGHVFNEYDSFLLLKTSQLGQYSELEAGKMGGRVGARPEGDRIYLMNLPPMTIDLRLKYIQQIIDKNQDDEMFGSSDLDAMVLDLTLEKLGYKAQKPEDKLTDGQSN